VPDALAPAESARDIIVRQAVEHLAPDQSLQRLGSSAQFILATSGLVGGALTGYGALASDQIKDHPTAGLLALIAASVSFFFAAWSLVGTGRALNLENENEILAFLGEEIRSRRWKVIAASVAFAIALPLASLSALLPRDRERPPTTLSVALGSGTPDLVVVGDGGWPGAGAHAFVSVRDPSGGLIASGRFASDRRGDLRFRLETEVPRALRRAAVKMHLVKRGRRLATMSYLARR
jgi:hypothetical protein